MNDYTSMAREFLEYMVACETVNTPGNELPLAQYIEKTLKLEGFETELQIIAPNRANVLAWTGHSDNHIILSGHLDVVPVGDGWNTNPFQVVEKNSLLYGRGTCDMKGGIAAMMAAAIKLKRENHVNDCKLVLVFAADEEIDGTGTKHFANSYEKGTSNWIILGEPTENQIHIAHRGVIRFKVTIKGKQCHSGQPDHGVNAVTAMSRFVLKIDELNKNKQKRHLPVLPAPTVAVTQIQGGIKDNVIPGECSAILDFRTIPGDMPATLRLELEQILNEIFTTTDIKWELSPFIHVAAGMTDLNSKIVHTLSGSYETLNNHQPQITYFPACCDMSCLLEHGFEVVICGPGSIEQAHTANEYMDKEQFEQAISLYEQFVMDAQK